MVDKSSRRIEGGKDGHEEMVGLGDFFSVVSANAEKVGLDVENEVVVPLIGTVPLFRASQSGTTATTAARLPAKASVPKTTRGFRAVAAVPTIVAATVPTAPPAPAADPATSETPSVSIAWATFLGRWLVDREPQRVEYFQ